ncbi:MAG: response regulator [Armatimonadetes bacterium]|jgi:two-component system alkaline phosphatase synthesis response regulator PhoP/two-component system response regulator VicR|nr:response regulator [Armatimonadota bacterium]MDI9601447.1 response regulator [Acidobacteriota bacterium]NLN89453.1 response regulator [candidate division WS1 bacterium]
MGKARVLVVDDAKPIVMVIDTNLRLAGYDVLTAYNGREALQAIREHRPDCVILDIMMPEMSGWEVLEEVRADPEIAKTQIMMLTALGDDSDISRGYELGVDMYLTKPFEPDELIEFVERVLEIGREEGLLDDDDDF